MKALMVIAPENFRDEEYLVPKKRLEEAGIEITTASTKTGTAKGMFGATADVNTVLDSVNATDYDIVLVVGGSATPSYLWNNKTLHTIVQQAAGSGKTVAAICLSGAVLANAGILKGKNATVYATPDSLALLKEGGANYVKEPVVTDGNIITAEGPTAADAFASAILSKVGK